LLGDILYGEELGENVWHREDFGSNAEIKIKGLITVHSLIINILRNLSTISKSTQTFVSVEIFVE